MKWQERHTLFAYSQYLDLTMHFFGIHGTLEVIKKFAKLAIAHLWVGDHYFLLLTLRFGLTLALKCFSRILLEWEQWRHWEVITNFTTTFIGTDLWPKAIISIGEGHIQTSLFYFMNAEILTSSSKALCIYGKEIFDLQLALSDGNIVSWLITAVFFSSTNLLIKTEANKECGHWWSRKETLRPGKPTKDLFQVSARGRLMSLNKMTFIAFHNSTDMVKGACYDKEK